LPPLVEREVEGAMRDFLHFSLDRDARSLAFLDEVRRTRRPVAAMRPAADSVSDTSTDISVAPD
jgi:hypothetical protein